MTTMTPMRMTRASTSIVVRRATIADAEAIATVHVVGWQQTYGHLVPRERLDALAPSDRIDGWRGILAGIEEKAWVAELDGAVVAWITTAARNPQTQPRDLELNGIYALESAHGSGVAQALLDEALGDAPAFLWVAADNPRAHAFYRRNGFVDDGSRDEHPLLGVPVSILRMVR